VTIHTQCFDLFPLKICFCI